MAERHLHELLREEQEPFILRNYIDERRCQLKRSGRKPDAQIPTSSSSCNFCRNPCLLSFLDSDPRKSPLLDFKRSPSLPKHRSAGFRFLSSVLKILAPRRAQKREIRGKETPVSILKEDLKWVSAAEPNLLGSQEENDDPYVAIPSSSSERSDWWKGSEGKSEGRESFHSCSSSGSVDFECSELQAEGDSGFFPRISGSCSTPFRFRCVRDSPEPSFQLLIPDFRSPTDSPCCRQDEQAEGVGTQLFAGTGVDDKAASSSSAAYEAEEENEDEQQSPVSVLDPPFSEAAAEEQQEEDDDEDGRDHAGAHQFKHSLAAVQRVKHQLLRKLRRFERLAALDPIELDVEELADEVDEEEEDGAHKDADAILKSDNENMPQFAEKGFVVPGAHLIRPQIPSNESRLVMDLAREEREAGAVGREALLKRIHKKMEWWRNVECNTVDMTVELDLGREREEWLKNPKEVEEIVVMVDLVIFRSLVDELMTDLKC